MKEITDPAVEERQGLHGVGRVDEEVLSRGRARRPGQRLRLQRRHPDDPRAQAVRQRPLAREHHEAGGQREELRAAAAAARHQGQHEPDGLRARSSRSSSPSSTASAGCCSASSSTPARSKPPAGRRTASSSKGACRGPLRASPNRRFADKAGDRQPGRPPPHLVGSSQLRGLDCGRKLRDVANVVKGVLGHGERSTASWDSSDTGCDAWTPVKLVSPHVLRRRMGPAMPALRPERVPRRPASARAADGPASARRRGS